MLGERKRKIEDDILYELQTIQIRLKSILAIKEGNPNNLIAYCIEGQINWAFSIIDECKTFVENEINKG